MPWWAESGDFPGGSPPSQLCIINNHNELEMGHTMPTSILHRKYFNMACMHNNKSKFTLDNNS